METGLVHLHSILRWLILLFLLITLFQAFGKNKAISKTSLWLLIFTHINFLVGVYQVLNGRFGILKGRPGSGSLMADDFYRFYWIEHPLAMIIAVALITVARRKAKALNYKATGWLLLIALLFILAAVPWPFRGEPIARPWFPGT